MTFKRVKALLKRFPGIGKMAELRQASQELERFKTTFAPGHFYSSVPDLRELQLREASLFGGLPEVIPGIDLNPEGQRELLGALARFYPEMPFARGKQEGLRYYFENSSFAYADAIVLYSMIRHLRPRRIVEIGCGFSSCVMLDTNERFFSGAIQCVFIDPFPQLLHTLLKTGDTTRIELIQDYVQDVPLKVFSTLGENDILFVDSSHVLKTGGDLHHILFQVLPRLRAGVYVHFHDTPFPFEYPRDWVFGGRAWNECYALRAFLQYNQAFEIVYFNLYLTKGQRAFFEQNMPLCLENEGGSLWLRKTKEESIPEAAPQPVRDFKPGHKFDAAYVDHPRQLGKGWHESDQDMGGRWMGMFAEVTLRGPERPGQKIVLRGLQPNPQSVMLNLCADGVLFAKCALREGSFAVTEQLPDNLVNREKVLLGLQIDRTYRPAHDERELGLHFGTIEIV
jgi:hypothetical protein